MLLIGSSYQVPDDLVVSLFVGEVVYFFSMMIASFVSHSTLLREHNCLTEELLDFLGL